MRGIIHNEARGTGELRKEVLSMVAGRTCKEISPMNRTNVINALRDQKLGLNGLARLLNNIGYKMEIKIVKA